MVEQKGPFKVVSSREVYRNRWMSVREDKVIRPGGKDGLFGVVDIQPGISVLALDKNDEVYLVKEFKYAVGRDSLEAVSGGIDVGELPLDAAKRELEEETGLKAVEWTELGVVDPLTTIVKVPAYLFLARGLVQGDAHPDDAEEKLEVVKVSLSQAVEMVMRSEITHAPSCVLILKAARFLEK